MRRRPRSGCRPRRSSTSLSCRPVGCWAVDGCCLLALGAAHWCQGAHACGQGRPCGLPLRLPRRTCWRRRRLASALWPAHSDLPIPWRALNTDPLCSSLCRPCCSCLRRRRPASARSLSGARARWRSARRCGRAGGGVPQCWLGRLGGWRQGGALSTARPAGVVGAVAVRERARPCTWHSIHQTPLSWRTLPALRP